MPKKSSLKNENGYFWLQFNDTIIIRLIFRKNQIIRIIIKSFV